jgi:hypothetical protein
VSGDSDVGQRKSIRSKSRMPGSKNDHDFINFMTEIVIRDAIFWGVLQLIFTASPYVGEMTCCRIGFNVSK